MDSGPRAARGPGMTEESYPSASATALPQVTVSAGPLRSRVRNFGSANTFSIALTMALAASCSPR